MAAKQHYNFPGVTQLVQQEVTKGGLGFYVDRDYEFYLQTLHESAAEYNCHIHAYALLPGKVLLLVTPYSDSAISQMMHSLSQRYNSHFNSTYGSTESLWQGGYSSCLLEAEEYLLDCMRYIEFDSIREGQVEKVEDWKWSSYHRNALNISDTNITPHPVYMSLADDDDASADAVRAANYNELIRLKIRDREDIEEISATLHVGGILGVPEFRQKYRQLDSAKKLDTDSWGCVMCY